MPRPQRLPKSYVDRLRDELAGMADEFMQILDHSQVRYLDWNPPGSSAVVVGFADWAWAPSDASLTSARMTLLGRYNSWFDRLRLLFPHPTQDVQQKLDHQVDFVRRWLLRPDTSDFTIPASIDAAKETAQDLFRQIGDLLDLTRTTEGSALRLVPDTNALLNNPDLASYTRSLPADRYVVHLLPTVLRELDELKDRGRSNDLRDNAQSVIRRIKGLRDKGSLATGVPLTKTMAVRAESREVNPPEILGWLTAHAPDDRILAGALSLQSSHPADLLLLITSDLNLQNKADAVGLPYQETPPSPASRRAGLTASINYRTSAEHPTGYVPQATVTNMGQRKRLISDTRPSPRRRNRSESTRGRGPSAA